MCWSLGEVTQNRVQAQTIPFDHHTGYITVSYVLLIKRFERVICTTWMRVIMYFKKIRALARHVM